MDSITALRFATRKSLNSSRQQKFLATNYFPIKIDASTTFYRYAANITPEIPGDAYDLRRSLLKTCSKKLMEFLGDCLIDNTVIYSKKLMSQTMTVTLERRGVEYNIEFKLCSSISPNSPERTIVMKKLMQKMLGQVNFKMWRKRFLDTSESTSLFNDNYLVMPSYDYRIVELGSGGLSIKIDSAYKIIRNETVLDFMNKRRDKGVNLQEKLVEELKGQVVMTRYNNDKTYVINNVDFNLTPLSIFSSKGTDKRFVDYYVEKYETKISVAEQPLLEILDKKDGSVIYLVPELCYCTGLTDEVRSDFTKMTEFNKFNYLNALATIKQNVVLIDKIEGNKEAKKIKDEWGINFDKNPFSLKGWAVDRGLMVIKNNRKVDALSKDAEREVLNNNFANVSIDKWAVVCSKQDEAILASFMEFLQKSCESSNFDCPKPDVHFLHQMNIETIKETVMKKMDPSFSIVIFIIPGQKQRSPLYPLIKRFTLTDCPIPTQIVCKTTLSKPRSLRSIVEKILLQIKVKIGGMPWTISTFPYSEKPTMIVGLGQFNKVTGLVASMNPEFSSYFSRVDKNQGNATAAFEEAVKKFIDTNGSIARIIVLDSVSKSNEMVLKENVTEFKKFLKNESIPADLIYVKVDKNSKLNFFQKANNSYSGVEAGVAIDSEITSDNVFDFFIITANARQGIPKAVNFVVIYADEDVNQEEIEEFCYKMCFMYFNWIGSVKLPAPCKLAEKLAELCDTSKGKGEKFCEPSDLLRTTYFI